MNKFHIVRYVENCTPKTKKLNDIEKMEAFIKKFSKEYPDEEIGYWIDFYVTDICGEYKELS